MVAAVIAYDDLEYAEGRNVIAGHSVIVGFREGRGDVWYELDLTDEHAELLERYRKAGRRISPHQQPAPVRDTEDVPRYGRVLLWHAVGISIRMYWRNYRAWAHSRGYQTSTDGGNVSYRVDEVEEYERYLSGLDRTAAARAG